MTPLLYLIRHAAPDWTLKDIPYHIPPGPPLTEQGLQEAEQLGLYLKQAGVQRLFASPLERALHTARIAARACDIPLEIDQGLIEWQPNDIPESVHQRIWPAFEAACQVSQQIGPVGLVTHGGPISVLLRDLGMTEEDLAARRVFDHRNPVPTAGAWEVSQDGEAGSWSLRLVFQPNPTAVGA